MELLIADFSSLSLCQAPPEAQFLGDYATAVADNTTGWFVWTDTRNDAACAPVDAFRNGTGPKPNSDLQCPATGGKSFGNSDIFVGAVGF